MQTTQHTISLRAQQGVALVFFVFIVGLFISGLLIKTLNNQNSQFNSISSTSNDLGRAKNALISWAVTNSVNLGQLPYPDRNNGGGYDGFSDCPPSETAFNTPSSYRLLIGKLPVYGQTTPCVGNLVGLGLGANEYLEKRLWYAVSRNVVHQYEFPANDAKSNPIINPNLINNPTYPWLKVLDKNGNLVSDRVAAVIIAPGNAIGNQSRSNVANTENFLDSFQKNGRTLSNADYGSADEDFVIGDLLANIANDDTSISRPYYFNDTLVFITIDELITAMNKRVLAEGKWLLNAYKTKSGQFPNAALLNKITIETDIYSALTSNTSGLLPIDITDNCQCTNDKTCTCSFGVIDTVTMYRKSGTWNNVEDAGACKSTLKASGKECTCTGAGSCSRSFATSTTKFSCQLNGECTHNLIKDSENAFTYTLPSHLNFHNVTNSCKKDKSNVICNDVGDFSIGLNEPSWFRSNRWQQFVYYAFSPSGEMQAGDRKNLYAILIAMGQPITTEIGVEQTRPSDSIQDYLDSSENSDDNDIFDSTFKRPTSQYNDEMLIVSP